MLYALIVCIIVVRAAGAALLLISAWPQERVLVEHVARPDCHHHGKGRFGTRYIVDCCISRTWGIWDHSESIRLLRSPQPRRLFSLADLFDNVGMSKAFLEQRLWLGLAALLASLPQSGFALPRPTPECWSRLRLASRASI